VNSHTDERGAVAVITAIMALLLFAAAAYAIDLGNVWQTRRNMVTASDAAALGAAGKFALGNDGCASDVAPALLTNNRSDASLDVCSPSTTDTKDGYVTVKGHTTAEFSFAGLFGMQNHVVSSTTTARWGIASGAVGLRPIALCITATPELEQWLNLPNGPTGPTTTPITITLSNSQPDPCKDSGGNVAGNWGLAIGDGNNSTSDTVDWLFNGYPTEVNVGDDIHANTGAFSGSVQNALQTLRDNGTWFPLPVFDRVDGAANGNNASYHTVSFVWVQLVAFQVAGAQSQRFITINLDRGVLQGSCCSTGPDTGTRAVRICDVDTLNPDTTDPSAC
jgi:Flp pilus assembly protein TadG